jgi:Protein of unknown function (DUF3095)
MTGTERQQPILNIKPDMSLSETTLTADDSIDGSYLSATTFCEVDKTPDKLSVTMGGVSPDNDAEGQPTLARKSFQTASTEATSIFADVDIDDDDIDNDAEKTDEEDQQPGNVKQKVVLSSSTASLRDIDASASQARVRRLLSFSQKAMVVDSVSSTSESIHTSTTGDFVADATESKTDDKQERRQSSSVRFGSIVLNELDVDALQEKIEVEENEKSWLERQMDWWDRSRLQEQVVNQMQLLHEAHGQHTLLQGVPDAREETKKLTTTWYPSPTGQGLSVSIQFRKSDSLSFYTAMKSFAHFKDITRDINFEQAPEDWHVVITDVKGSTKAIEAGRYKDVNTIGAASISVVLKLLEDDVPFVFGGDGATLLIPPTDIGRVVEALLRLQRLSEEHFNLGLRVGHVSVGEVHKAGGRIEVAKHELTAGRCVAIFRGGGLTVAEAFIKGQEDKYCVQWKLSSYDIELEGLSCRWNPIPNKRGKIMSLLVCAREGESPSAVYDHVLQELDKIYDGKLDEANPVNTDLMYYKSVGQCYEEEERYHTNTWSSSFFARVAEIFLAVGIFKQGLPMTFDQKHYFESMRPHADHRKFDDMLRMVIDCSEEQVEAIETLMEELYMNKELHYGIFLSETALMTCYLEDLVDGQHIHFIDGGDGGYAMAAKQLKAQLKNDLLSG